MPADPPPAAAHILRAVATTVIAVFPVALVASFSLLIRADLAFSPFHLALVVGAFYVASALMSFSMGHFAVAERLGTTRSTVLGLLLTASALLLMATAARTWQELGVFMALSGVGNGFIQPTANLALSRRVRSGRLGLAFGIKQAAVPGATFLAGAAAAATGILAGWRWAFVTGAVVAALVAAAELVLAHRADSRSPSLAARPADSRPGVTHSLRRMVVAGALGSVANNAMRVFFVESAVAHGQSLAAAGTILGIGSIAGIVTRLIGGWRSDRSGMDPVRSAGVLMVLGSVGYALMGWADGTTALLLASVLGIAAGWGWAGLLQLGLVRAQPERAGAASGFLHSATLTGSLVGPILFSLIVPEHGYAAGWMIVATFGLAAGVVLLSDRGVARRRLDARSRGAA